MSKIRYPCPCCGYLTLPEEGGSGSFDICPVCRWEDDNGQFRHPEMPGGANVVKNFNTHYYDVDNIFYKDHLLKLKVKGLMLHKQNVWSIMKGN